MTDRMSEPGAARQALEAALVSDDGAGYEEYEAALAEADEQLAGHKARIAHEVAARDRFREKLEQAEAEADRQEELIEALDPHGLRRKKLGLGGTP